jgi:HK97 gp10 family phage protein
VRASYELRLRERAADRAAHIAQEIVDEIAGDPETPTETGHLRRSYYVDRDGDTAVIKTTADYWRYVEFGTGHGEAQPHVRPAVEMVRARHT